MAPPVRLWRNAPVPHPAKAVIYFACIGLLCVFLWSMEVYRMLPTILIACIASQVIAFVSIPTFVFVMRWVNRRRRANGEEEHEFMAMPSRWGPLTFSIVCMAWYIGVDWVDELELWKRAHIFQCVAYAPLILKILVKQNVSGISAGTLQLNALALILRLVATGWDGIILPRESGNDFIRACDKVALGIVLVLILCVQVLFRKSYSPEKDSFRIEVPALACVGLALVLHAEVGRVGFVADSIWTASLYIEGIAMMPQLFLIGQNGGLAEEVVCHHITAVFFTREVGLMFWWLIKGHWMQGTQVTGWVIQAVYAGQMILLCNFLCWYVKSLFENGLTFNHIVCTPNPVKEEGKEKES